MRVSLAADIDTPQTLAAVDARSVTADEDTAAPALVRDLVDALLCVVL